MKFFQQVWTSEENCVLTLMSIDAQCSKDTLKIFKVLIRTVSLLFLLCDLSCQWGRSIIDPI